MLYLPDGVNVWFNCEQNVMNWFDASAGRPTPLGPVMKPVQFFGVLPVCPSEKLAMRGAVVQFIIPGLKISGEELNSFQKIAVACGDGVESAHFKRVHSDPDKHPATLVSIAFHV